MPGGREGRPSRRGGREGQAGRRKGGQEAGRGCSAREQRSIVRGVGRVDLGAMACVAGGLDFQEAGGWSQMTTVPLEREL